MTPPTGTIQINWGDAATRYLAATLNLTCVDDVACSQVQFSNDNITWSASQSYAATRSWSLTSGNGVKTVYAKYRDAAGNWSAVVSDTIVLDTAVPVNGTLAATIISGAGQIALDWNGFSER